MKKISLLIVLVISVLQMYAHPKGYVKVKPYHSKVVVVRPGSPGPGHIWIDGDWVWSPQAKQYVWVEGKWVIAKPGVVWVPGRWKKSRHGWYWLNGHWR